MSEFFIKTRSPLHIGSGEDMIRNYDYLYFPKEEVIARLSEKKLFSLLGGNEEASKSMLDLVKNGKNLYEYLKNRFEDSLTPAQVAESILPLEGPGPTPKTETSEQRIRQQILSAGKPCIPGSSIKGAIRTALLSLYIEEDSDDRRYGNQNFLTNRRGKFSDEGLQGHHLGKDPNHDLFRLLQVGDAVFHEQICTLAKSVNLQGRSFVFKESNQQYVACIPAEAEGTIRIRQHELLATTVKKRKVREVKGRGRQKSLREYYLYPSSKLDDMRLERLIFFTNQHTKILIENELEFWETESYPNEVGRYLEVLEELNEELEPLVENKNGDRCIMRLGWGTGFLNMTGGWQEAKMSDGMYNKLKEEVRGRKYNRFPLPKTRRMAYDGTPFGFIELNRR